LLATKLGAAPTTSGLRSATAGKVQPISLALVETFVADDDLARVTDEQIVAYKDANGALFRQFTSEVVQISNAIKELPLDEQFEAALKELQMTDLWRRRNDIAADLRDAWTAFFKQAKGATAWDVLPVEFWIALLVRLTELASNGDAPPDYDRRGVERSDTRSFMESVRTRKCDSCA
jgi:hypothetical protein